MEFEKRYRRLMDSVGPEKALKAAVLKKSADPGAKERKTRRPAAYAAAAVCAALGVLCYPAYRALQPQKPTLHSYVTGQGGYAVMDTAGTTAGTADAEEKATVTFPADPQEDGGGREGWEGEYDGDVMPGGALAPDEVEVDAAAQEQAIQAYMNLMNWFEENGYGYGNYPDWYGGAYVSGTMLFVCVLDPDGSYDKDFYLQIQTWAGGGERTDAVGFTGANYSLNHLQGLQEKVVELLDGRPDWGCGVNEMTGQLELEIAEADEELLAALAELDPKDDAILVRVGAEFQIGEAVSAAVDAVGNVDDRDGAFYG